MHLIDTRQFMNQFISITVMNFKVDKRPKFDNLCSNEHIFSNQLFNHLSARFL